MKANFLKYSFVMGSLIFLSACVDKKNIPSQAVNVSEVNKEELELKDKNPSEKVVGQTLDTLKLGDQNGNINYVYSCTMTDQATNLTEATVIAIGFFRNSSVRFFAPTGLNSNEFIERKFSLKFTDISSTFSISKFDSPQSWGGGQQYSARAKLETSDMIDQSKTLTKHFDFSFFPGAGRDGTAKGFIDEHNFIYYGKNSYDVLNSIRSFVLSDCIEL